MTKSKSSLKMEELNQCLASRGLKSTQQRYYIADTFFKTSTHLSLDELLKKVKRKTPRIGYATVYRTMKLLTECGLALERQFGDGQTRFENVLEEGHHDHIICLKCSKIVEFQNQKIEKLQEETALKLGFKVVRHKLELYGYCSDCS
ncbi:MAG: transcriptional repressor [Deltaproteobacteria bacterium]|nr:transcriptional repressor [Deltaproteobacteria bacterium]